MNYNKRADGNEMHIQGGCSTADNNLL